MFSKFARLTSLSWPAKINYIWCDSIWTSYLENTLKIENCHFLIKCPKPKILKNPWTLSILKGKFQKLTQKALLTNLKWWKLSSNDVKGQKSFDYILRHLTSDQCCRCIQIRLPWKPWEKKFGLHPFLKFFKKFQILRKNFHKKPKKLAEFGFVIFLKPKSASLVNMLNKYTAHLI